MTDLVPPEDIEKLVGLLRNSWRHVGRAVPEDDIFYIMHSHECLARDIDLRECEFSIALDRGLWKTDWRDYENCPCELKINKAGRLVPAKRMG